MLGTAVKVPLDVPCGLPAVDVVLSPRKRLWAPVRNWNGWEQLASGLLAAGFTVGIAGAKETSAEIPATVHAWQHPGGQTAGTIDLLKHCRWYVGNDSGVSHLAALLDIPSIIIPHGGPGMQLDILSAANRSGMEICEAWQSPELALQTVLSKL
jgi:hypothetical protein